MGQYLKQQYEERELANTLAKVHGIIDEETRKLCDKVKNLTLSHNRKKKALQKIERIMLNFGVLSEDVAIRDTVLDICENALFTDGRAEIN